MDSAICLFVHISLGEIDQFDGQNTERVFGLMRCGRNLEFEAFVA